MINFFKLLWENFIQTKLADYTLANFLLVAGSLVIVLFLGIILIKVLLKIFKATGRSFKGRSKKEKCKRITCKFCGRNLAECVCQKNKKLSYGKRLKLFRQEEKAEKIRKIQETNKTK